MFRSLLKKTRSCRRFNENFNIDKEILINLVDLARISPCMRNQQALKFTLSNNPEKNDLIFPCLSWAAALKDWRGPAAGERPSAYIVILGDTKISKDFGLDHGIAAMNMLLGATELGLGGCMVGSLNRDTLRLNLKINPSYEILLVVSLGKPAEKIVLEDLKNNSNTNYYRDKDNVHHVPKRKLEELIIA